MAPIRRYLRITKFSVLECRIYVDNPALAESWLLNPRDPILPRVIESVRPLVLPKLREENERSKSKGNKKKGVKDVVIEEDFEVSIFLTETSTRHTLLTKLKTLREPNKKAMQSNSAKLTGQTNDAPIEVEDGPMIAREEGGEDVVLQDVPEADDVESEDGLFVPDSRPKRPRTTTNISHSSSPGFEPLPKRRRDEGPEEASDDKKKMGMDTTYDGFSIYGRVLCLLVKRRDRRGKAPANLAGGQATMENWISSTQMPQDED